MTRWRMTLLLSVLAVSGCGRTMCDLTDLGSTGAKVGFRIDDFGPRHAKAGEGFNVQPDGSSAAWFKIDRKVEGSVIRVHLGDLVVPGGGTGDVVTVKVPDAVHANPGKVMIMIERLDGSEVTRSNTVTMILDKP